MYSYIYRYNYLSGPIRTLRSVSPAPSPLRRPRGASDLFGPIASGRIPGLPIGICIGRARLSALGWPGLAGPPAAPGTVATSWMAAVAGPACMPSNDAAPSGSMPADGVARRAAHGLLSRELASSAALISCWCRLDRVACCSARAAACCGENSRSDGPESRGESSGRSGHRSASPSRATWRSKSFIRGRGSPSPLRTLSRSPQAAFSRV